MCLPDTPVVNTQQNSLLRYSFYSKRKFGLAKRGSGSRQPEMGERTDFSFKCSSYPRKKTLEINPENLLIESLLRLFTAPI